MRRRNAFGAVAWSIGAVSVLALGTLSPAISAVPAQSQPLARQSQFLLEGVTALSASDAWTVGDFATGGGFTGRPLAEHWDGTTWSRVPVPRPGRKDSDGFFSGVNGSASDDVWAVGTYLSKVTPIRMVTLAEHWDGSSWSIVSTPNPSGMDDYQLSSVSAVSADDVWAVGSGPTGIVEHWDGASWRLVAGAKPPGGGGWDLWDVDARSASDVWAVGENFTSKGTIGFIEHWDGSTWKQVPSAVPPGKPRVFSFSGVSAVSADDVWAVGFSSQDFGGDQRPLIEHWDGTSWQLVEGAGDLAAAITGGLVDVTAVGADDVWAVGHSKKTGSYIRTLIEHWDGTAWSRVHSPNVRARGNNFLDGVAATSAGDAWSVGGHTDLQRKSIIEHWDGTSWDRVHAP
jgi:hypothetical protein